MQFSDDINPSSADTYSQRDKTFDLAKNEDCTLSQFLSRPIKVHEFSWAVGGSLDSVIDPWSVFVGNPSVVDRINNFAFLRGDLRLKILINGNSFYYGKILAAYHPLESFDDVYAISAAGTNPDMELMAMSQMPSAEIDSNNSKGCELNCDYVWPYNYVRLNNNDNVSDLGRLRIKSYQSLRHANGGTDSLSVSVFAWLENVVLTTPTTATFQSGFFSGEYGKGAISGIATSVSSVANKLASVPVIGPYAKATSDVASTLGGVARAFGFSRPVNLDCNMPMRRNIISSMATTDSDETIEKLSLDSKQELSVDPRTCGVQPHDEMSLAYVLPKESYLTQFGWSVTDNADHLLFNSHVSPTVCNIDTTVATPLVPIIGHTPMSHASQLFQYWTGSIVYRFSIVASAYHKGRLRITIDPFYKGAGVTNWNHVYSRIVDISEERDFEICVSWLQNQAFKPIHNMVGVSQGYGSLPYVGIDETSNGVISVEVLNGLTTPNDASTDITIMAYVRGGEDMSFTGPVDHLTDIKSHHGTFQSGLMAAPNGESVNPLCVGDDGERSLSDSTFDVYAGEKAVSFRQLLRRYWFYRLFDKPRTGSSSSMKITTFHNPVFPAYSGPEFDGYDVTAVGAGYNYVGTTLLNYLTPAYICRRGAIRYKFVKAQNHSSTGNQLWANRATTAITSFVSSNFYSSSIVSETAYRGSRYTHTGAGAALTMVQTQPALEVEFPFYSDARFAYARDLNIKGRSDDRTNLQNYELSTIGPGAGTSEDSDIIQSFVSTGEDFMLAMYLHAPAVYVFEDPTAN